jgi:hypothetical protein
MALLLVISDLAVEMVDTLALVLGAGWVRSVPRQAHPLAQRAAMDFSTTSLYAEPMCITLVGVPAGLMLTPDPELAGLAVAVTALVRDTALMEPLERTGLAVAVGH